MSNLYTPENVSSPAYQLRFGWTGWPSNNPLPTRPNDSLLAELERLWEQDGIRHLESRWSPEIVQYTVSVKPDVSPVFIAGRLKGRLDHTLRQAGTPVKFSRKVSLCSLGNARQSVIEAYIEKQVLRHRFADPKTAALFARYAVQTDVNLALPTESRSGRYWYNLHLVLELRRRQPSFDERRLQEVNEACARTALTNGYGISRLSPMPNHLHIGLRGNIEQSPEQIALAFMNTIADGVGQTPIWEYSYYVGTFGEYDMGALHVARSGSACFTGRASRPGVCGGARKRL